MSKFLPEPLPGIVAARTRQAAKILEQREARNCFSLHERERLVPSEDRGGFNLWHKNGDGLADDSNCPICGDDLLATGVGRLTGVVAVGGA